MKKLILIFLLLSSACYAFDGQQTQFQQVTFNSTSNFNACTSYSPHITPVGSTSVYGETNVSPQPVNGPRRINYPYDPYASPVGDVPFSLMVVLFIWYCLLKRKEKTVSV